MRMGDKEPFHPVPPTCRAWLQKCPTLFVGYSLIDYNFRLLFKSLRWKMDKAKMPNTYSVDPYPDPLIVKIYDAQGQVTFIAEDAWDFCPRLYKAVKNQDMPK